jgi:hypothetical protein
MRELRTGLVLSSPARPPEEMIHRQWHPYHNMPEQMANLCDTQPYQSPRWALNAAKLLPLSTISRPFFGRSAATA